jgi:hypothetical protein
VFSKFTLARIARVASTMVAMRRTEPRGSLTASCETKLAQLIYIGGYGRSGSTLLEALLTADRNVVACGEVARHLRRVKANKTCTCGRPIKHCPVWSPFRHEGGSLKGWDHRRLTLALLDHVSRNFLVMGDSSKTAWGSGLMPFRLRRKLGREFLLIHLVRDPRAVCWSTIRALRRGKKTGGELARCLQTVFGWTSANIACEVFGLLHPKNYVRLRYEDLVRAPRRVLAPIFGRVALEPASLNQWVPSDNRHQLHGNRMRHEPLSLAALRKDAAWKTEMPRKYRRLAAGLSWPLGARYKYFRQ